VSDWDPRRPSGLALLGVLALAALILLIPVARRPFWSSDEARFALLAQDILDHGRWLMPELRGQPYLNKPQLYFWSIALVSIPFGRVTELSASIPSAASAVAAVAGVVEIGRFHWGWRAGALAGLILATTPMYFVLGHRVLADVMLTAWTIWALYFLLRARRAGWTTGPLLAFYACVGGAMASKGPGGLAALVAAVVAALVTGGWRELGRLKPLPGGALLALLALAWIVPYLAHSQARFVGEVLVDDYLAWYFRSGVLARLGHVASALPNFLPWTVFLAGAVVWWRRAPDGARWWIGAWTLALWLLLGLSGTHRARYLLPVYPGLALLTAEFLTVAPATGGRRALRAATLALALLAAAALALPFLYEGAGEESVYLPEAAWERVVLIALVAGLVPVLALAALRQAFGAGAAVVALAIGAVLIVEGVTYPPRYARAFGARELALAAAAHAPPEATVYGHPDLKLSYDFYLKRRVGEIPSEDALARKLAFPSRDVVLIARERWATVAPAADPSWRVLAARTIAGREMVVVGSGQR